MKSTRGFTLLEVIIAVTILAFLSIFTARMIQQGLQAKNKIQNQIDRTGQLNAALQLMTRDLEMAFHYRDVNTELYNAAQKERQNRNKKPTGDKNEDGNPTAPSAPNPPAPADAGEGEKYALKEEKTYTRFLGEADRIDFTSLNNFRSVPNMQQSNQMEVGYYLETCSGRNKKQGSSECLWRRTSAYIDDEVKEGGQSQVLLENVKSLKFRYLGPGHEEEWIDKWQSVNGEEVMKNKFPTAVEITLEIYDRRTDPPKEIVMTVVAALRFPNNKPEEKSGVVN